MALRVWLPLNGNINNYGISDLTFTNTSTSMIAINNSGKIGKCYSFNSTSSNNGIYGADITAQYINNKSWSLCAWVKTTSSDTCIMSLSYGLRLFAGNSIYVSLYNSSRTVNCQATGKSTTDGLWHHIVAAYDHILNKIYIFVDGLLINTVNYTAGYIYASSWNNGTYIGKDPNNTTVNDHYLYKGLMNDVRIYDHCLSPKEVKEISKGLCLHYKLDGVCNTIDSIEWDCSGFGNNGTKSGSITTIDSGGRYSKAYSFNGNLSNYISATVNNLVNVINSQQLTVSYWCYDTNSGGNSNACPVCIGSAAAQNKLLLLHANAAYGIGLCFYSNDLWNTSIKLTPNTWNLLTFVINNGTRSIYLNGNKISSATYSSNLSVGTPLILGIGKDPIRNSYQLAGSISDLRIYATSLSDADIKELYNTSLSIDNVGNMYTYEFKEIE